MTTFATLHPDQHAMRERLESALNRVGHVPGFAAPFVAVVSTLASEQALPHMAWTVRLHIVGGDIELAIDGQTGIEFGRETAFDAVAAYASRWGTGTVAVERDHDRWIAESYVLIGGLRARVWGEVNGPLAVAA